MLLINPSKSTKKCTMSNVPVDQCTMFQIISPNKSVIDFTLGRLKSLHNKERDPSRLLQLQDMIEQYSAGMIAVGFHKGRPTFIRATRGA